MKITGALTGQELLRQHAKDIEALKRGLGVIARLKVYPSTQRPDPVGRAGAQIWDIGLGRPLYSNGTEWVTAGGEVVTGVTPVGRTFVGPVMPVGLPTGLEYVWYKTDGVGHLTDTIVGIT